MIATEVLFTTHLYTFGGEAFKQLSGGPIGLRATCAIARLVMCIWDTLWKQVLVLGLWVLELGLWVLVCHAVSLATQTLSNAPATSAQYTTNFRPFSKPSSLFDCIFQFQTPPCC